MYLISIRDKDGQAFDGSKTYQKNADGSIDIFLGPKAPAGKDSNWIPTDRTRKFELMFRAYGPTKELFEKTWVLPDVEKLPAR